MKLRTYLYRIANTPRQLLIVLVLFHTITLILAATIYYMVMPWGVRPDSPNTLGRDFLLCLPALAYAMYLSIRFRQSKRTPSNRRTYLTLMFLPCITTLVIIVLFVFNPMMIRYVGEVDSPKSLVLPALLCNLMLMLTFSFLYLYTRATQTRLQLIIAEHERSEYHFHLLRNQMNPHFLFNALNVAASLPYEDAEKASQFIKRLGTVYRYMLQTNDKQTVKLATEMDFVQSYLYLEQVRFDDKLQVVVNVDESLLERRVVPGSVQMLIENALKHNVATAESPLKVEIVADKHGITVSNNVQLRELETRPGQGLQNLRQQYAQLGRDMEVRRDDKRFVVSLSYV